MHGAITPIPHAYSWCGTLLCPRKVLQLLRNERELICVLVQRLDKRKTIPVQALRVPGGLGPNIPRILSHEGGKIDSPTHRPRLAPRHIPRTRYHRLIPHFY